MLSYRMASLFKVTVFTSTCLLHLSRCRRDGGSSLEEGPNVSNGYRCNQMCAVYSPGLILRCKSPSFCAMLNITTEGNWDDNNSCSSISGNFYATGDIGDSVSNTLKNACDPDCFMREIPGTICTNEKMKELFKTCVVDRDTDWEWNLAEVSGGKHYVLKRKGYITPATGLTSTISRFITTMPTSDYITPATGLTSTISRNITTMPTSAGKNFTDSTTSVLTSRVADMHTLPSRSEESSQQMNLALALGVGLGLALLIAIIIIIVLCICLARERRKKRGEKPYSTLAPSTATGDSRVASSAGSHVYTNIDPAVANAHESSNTPTTTPSHAKAPPTDYEEASTVRRPVSSSSIWPRATSVIYAVTDKLKPHRGNNKRTLATPSDDVIIVENDLYTDETVSGAANGPAGGRTGASNGPDAVYYNNMARTVDGELYAEVSK